MQRLFSMFPPGVPGFGLLLLRVAVATALVLDAYAHRQEIPGWMQGAAVLLSVVICVGYLTPLAASLVLVSHLLIWFGLDVENAIVTVVFCIDAIALALLGPGAYSLDSHLFGRRLVVRTPP